MSIVRETAIADVKPIPAAVGGVPAPIREPSDRLAAAVDRHAVLKALFLAILFDAAPSPACPVPHHHRHLISYRPELLRLHLPGLPALEDLLNRAAERNEAVSGSRFHGPGGIDVLDLRVHELDRSREFVPRPRVVEAPHDLHVLLRHRPRSISR
jgi:hypothetical protein